MGSRGSNQPPSENDFEVVRRLDNQIIVSALWSYLYDGGLNMQEIGLRLFPGDEDQSASEKVSSIMRCYGFSGRNAGYLQKTYGDQIDRGDIVAFVNKFSAGCQGDWPNHTTIDQFMQFRMYKKSQGTLEDEGGVQNEYYNHWMGIAQNYKMAMIGIGVVVAIVIWVMSGSLLFGALMGVAAGLLVKGVAAFHILGARKILRVVAGLVIFCVGGYFLHKGHVIIALILAFVGAELTINDKGLK